jgi:hypothetical protein
MQKKIWRLSNLLRRRGESALQLTIDSVYEGIPLGTEAVFEKP